MTRRNETAATLMKDTTYVTTAIKSLERDGLNLSLNPKPVSRANSRMATPKRVRRVAITTGAYPYAT
jgi:hypothetical protein